MKNKIERMKKHKEVMNLVSLREAPPRLGDEAIFKGLGSMVKRLLRFARNDTGEASTFNKKPCNYYG